MEDNNQIIIAAINATGSRGEDLAAWRLRVIENAASFAAMLSPSSDVSKAVASVLNSKVFTGTVLSVEKEKSSTRGLATLKTRVSEHSPDGTETVRTERTDSEYGRSMARRLRSLIGHKVIVWVEVQTMSNSTNKVRVVSHVEDLGEDDNVEAA